MVNQSYSIEATGTQVALCVRSIAGTIRLMHAFLFEPTAAGFLVTNGPREMNV